MDWSEPRPSSSGARSTADVGWSRRDGCCRSRRTSSPRARCGFQHRTVGRPARAEDPEPQGLAAAATAIGAREHRIVTGRLEHAALNRRERLMVRAVRAPDGDLRDWGEITAWAHSIAVALGRPPVISANS